jgi:hypothetical protein
MEVPEMPNATAEDLQKQILSAIRKGNEMTVETIKAAVGAVSSVKIPAPKMSTFSAPKFREDAVAYARKLPAPADVVESAFGFADRLLAEQRKFAGEVKKATASLRPSGDK